MGDRESVEVSCLRSPGSNAGRRARAREKNGRSTPEIVAIAVGRKMPLVRTPTEFAGLTAFADETIDRPSIDELIHTLANGRHLCVPLGDMNDFHVELFRQVVSPDHQSHRA